MAPCRRHYSKGIFLGRSMRVHHYFFVSSTYQMRSDQVVALCSMCQQKQVITRQLHAAATIKGSQKTRNRHQRLLIDI